MKIYYPSNGRLNEASLDYLEARIGEVVNLRQGDSLVERAEDLIRTQKELGGVDFYGCCLEFLLPAWKANGFDAKSRLTVLEQSTDAPARIHAAPGRFSWDDVEWVFPDAVIAKAMNVTRQAVTTRRKKLERTQESRDSFDIIAEAREAILSEELGISRFTARLLRTADVGSLRRKLAGWPDREDSEINRNFESIMRHDKNGGNPPDALQWVQAVKGVSPLTAARMILLVMPDLEEAFNREIDVRAGFAEGTTKAIRASCRNWRERFSMIPDVADAPEKDDPLLGVAEAKGVSHEEAAKLLWLVFEGELTRNFQLAE